MKRDLPKPNVIGNLTLLTSDAKIDEACRNFVLLCLWFHGSIGLVTQFAEAFDRLPAAKRAEARAIMLQFVRVVQSDPGV